MKQQVQGTMQLPSSCLSLRKGEIESILAYVRFTDLKLNQVLVGTNLT